MNDPRTCEWEARENILKRQKDMKRYYDRRRYQGLSFDVGEIIVIRKPAEATGEPTKTQGKYRGPYIITEKLPGDVYRIQHLNPEGKRKFSTTIHVTQIKSYHNPEVKENLEIDTNEEEDSEEENEVNSDEENDNGHTDTTEKQDEKRELPNRASERVRKTPKYLDDYVTDKQKPRTTFNVRNDRV